MRDAAGSPSTSHYHAVRFYDSEHVLIQMVAEFLAAGIASSHPAIIVATPPHRAGILRELVRRGLDVVHLQQSGDLLLLDAEHTLATSMTEGIPDAAQFKQVMGEVIKRACRGRTDCMVRVYGEMVDLLWQRGERDAAIRLEVLWNQLANTETFSLLCGYAMGTFLKDAHIDDVCGQHTHINGLDGRNRRAKAVA